jgi:hypothetical protein
MLPARSVSARTAHLAGLGCPAREVRPTREAPEQTIPKRLRTRECSGCFVSGIGLARARSQHRLRHVLLQPERSFCRRGATAVTVGTPLMNVFRDEAFLAGAVAPYHANVAHEWVVGDVRKGAQGYINVVRGPCTFTSAKRKHSAKMHDM